MIDFLAEQRRKGHNVTSLPAIDLAAIQVRQPRYEGDACPACGDFKMVRISTFMKCDLCGTSTGDD